MGNQQGKVFCWTSYLQQQITDQRQAVRGSLGCSNHVMISFRILRGGSKVVSRTTALDFRRADTTLSRDLFIRTSWDVALERRGIQESWLIFRHHLLQAQERSILINMKLSKSSMWEQGALYWTQTSKGGLKEVQILISLLVFRGLMSLNDGIFWLLIYF